jgi:hypothetical protein
MEKKKLIKKKNSDRSSRTIQCHTNPCHSYLQARCKKGEKDKPRQYMHITCGMYCLVDCVVCVASGEIQMQEEKFKYEKKNKKALIKK